MNKAELVRQLAERTSLSRAAAARAVEALFSTDRGGIIADALRGGDKVQITGFGSFESKRREARTGRNPRTGKEIGISASTSAGFRAGKPLRDTLGGPKGPGEGALLQRGPGERTLARVRGPLPGRTHGAGEGA